MGTDTCSVKFAVLLLILFAGSCSSLDECDVKRQRRCRQGLLQELEKQPSSRGDDEDEQAIHKMEFHCRKVRGYLNCLVLQVTRCPSPNRSGDLILKAWKYMEDNCDTFGGWWSYECFHLEQVKKCEKIFALRDAAVSHASCREYDRFRHCTSDVVQKHCNEEDERSLGNYLLDTAGDMVWTCPHQQATHKSPIVDEGFVGVVKPKSVEKAELVEKLVASDEHSPPLDHVQKKAVLGNKISAEESHLSNVFSSPLTGNSPFVTGCNARATEETRGCLDRHQYERDQALGARDDEDRLKKECCATWNYRRCLQNAVRIHCYDTREVDVQSAIDVIPHDRGFLCRNHWIYTCSGASPKLDVQRMSIMLLFTLVIMALQKTVSQMCL